VTLAIYTVLVALIIGVIMGLTLVLGPRRAHEGKMTPYECGVPLQMGARRRVPVKYYLVAILFVLFDIEVIFMFPWAVVYRSLGLVGIAEMIAFLAFLGWGLYYAWMRGALRWE